MKCLNLTLLWTAYSQHIWQRKKEEALSQAVTVEMQQEPENLVENAGMWTGGSPPGTVWGDWATLQQQQAMENV